MPQLYPADDLCQPLRALTALHLIISGAALASFQTRGRRRRVALRNEGCSQVDYQADQSGPLS